MLSKKLNSTMTASAVRVQTEAATLKSRVQTAVEEKEFGIVWYWVLMVCLIALAVCLVAAAMLWCQITGHGGLGAEWSVEDHGGWAKVGCRN